MIVTRNKIHIINIEINRQDQIHTLALNLNYKSNVTPQQNSKILNRARTKSETERVYFPSENVPFSKIHGEYPFGMRSFFNKNEFILCENNHIQVDSSVFVRLISCEMKY